MQTTKTCPLCPESWISCLNLPFVVARASYGDIVISQNETMNCLPESQIIQHI
jgi:hypothetical protein